MERVSSKVVHEGRIATVRVDGFRHPDGSTAEREIVGHPGAVAMIAHDERVLYMVRQPREAGGEEHLRELPAGKFDVEGESPIETAKRELAEEIGLQATEWRELKQIYTSPGFSDERVSIM
ncbi:MAG TPA: NUDIX hydrolase, partial [Solirubrobacterales bacterium]|nr:NUDIX hydrolase [Solirubrobacterales bacterium]